MTEGGGEEWNRVERSREAPCLVIVVLLCLSESSRVELSERVKGERTRLISTTTVTG